VADDKDKTEAEKDPAGTPGGLPPEKVEDRPDVSQVTPEDYPVDQRAR
jgi:hypothetical protein